MKLTCTQENLSNGLSIVGKSIGKDSALPILANVLLTTDNKRLKLTTTNLEIGTSCLIGAKIEEEGKITVPAQLLTNYINNLPADKIEIEVKGTDMKVSAGSYKANIKGIDHQEFPLIPKIDSKPFAKVSGRELKTALTQIIYAAAHDESRPEIAGVYLRSQKEKMKLAATDSYRLAEKELGLLEGTGGDEEMIVPISAMLELNRILSEQTEIVEISTSDNQVRFAFGDIELVSRLVEGQYPEYQRIIPKEFETKAQLSNKELTTALRTSSFFSKKDIAEVLVKTDLKKGALEIIAESGEVGKNVTLVKAEHLEGSNKEISFNPQYLLDCLLNIGTNSVNLMITADEKVGALQPVGEVEKDYIYIVMPIVKK